MVGAFISTRVQGVVGSMTRGLISVASAACAACLALTMQRRMRLQSAVVDSKFDATHPSFFFDRFRTCTRVPDSSGKSAELALCTARWRLRMARCSAPSSVPVSSTSPAGPLLLLTSYVLRLTSYRSVDFVAMPSMIALPPGATSPLYYVDQARPTSLLRATSDGNGTQLVSEYGLSRPRGIAVVPSDGLLLLVDEGTAQVSESVSRVRQSSR